MTTKAYTAPKPMYHMYEVIIDLGDNRMGKFTRPARNERDLQAVYGCGGDVIRIKDVTAGTPLVISRIIDALRAAGFSETEREGVAQIIRRNYRNVIDD